MKEFIFQRHTTITAVRFIVIILISHSSSFFAHFLNHTLCLVHLAVLNKMSFTSGKPCKAIFVFIQAENNIALGTLDPLRPPPPSNLQYSPSPSIQSGR